MRFRSSSKRQALGVVFLLGMGVALVQAEYGGRVSAATADELRAATGGVSMIEIGPYSSGSDFGCKDNGSSSPTAYVYEDNQCWTFTWSRIDPVDPPCSHVFHEHDGTAGGILAYTITINSAGRKKTFSGSHMTPRPDVPHRGSALT